MPDSKQVLIFPLTVTVWRRQMHVHFTRSLDLPCSCRYLPTLILLSPGMCLGDCDHPYVILCACPGGRKACRGEIHHKVWWTLCRAHHLVSADTLNLLKGLKSDQFRDLLLDVSFPMAGNHFWNGDTAVEGVQEGSFYLFTVLYIP